MGKRILYKAADGKRVPSVTTILSRFKDSGGLIHWANQQGLDGLTLDEARRKPAGAGTLAHDLVEADINGWPEPGEALALASAETVAQARRAFANFQKWRTQTRIEFLHTEVSLVSESWRVGGRLDAVGRDPDGSLAMVDFKTGPLYAEHLLQVAAYSAMWDEAYPDRPIRGGAHLISFRREAGDFGHHYFDDLAAERETFAAMRSLYDRVKAVERRAK